MTEIDDMIQEVDYEAISITSIEHVHEPKVFLVFSLIAHLPDRCKELIQGTPDRWLVAE